MHNWNWLKSFNRKELISMVPKGFRFKTKPWTHQIASFLAAISDDGFLCAADLGTGKTKVSIDVCRYISWLNKNKNIKVLYLCLNSAVEKMRDEVLTHSDFTAICIRGSKHEKEKLFDKKYNFYIINFESFRLMMTKKVLKMEKKVIVNEKLKTKKINKEVIDENKIRRFNDRKFDVLIVDESHSIKSQTSLIFRIVKKISFSIKNRKLLTGTPFGKTLLDVWPQYYIIDFGKTYSPNFNLFKKSYFKDIGYWGPLWVPTKEGERLISKRLFTRAIRYTEDEVDDLPPKNFRVLNYELSKKQRKIYNDLLRDEYDNLTKDIKKKGITFREITSGFIASSDYTFKKNPKLELMWDLIENVYEKHKIVVFVERTISREIIEKLLKKKKVLFNTMSGATKDKEWEWRTFQTDPEYRVMVANVKSGGASIDLFAANYTIYYELGGSVIQHKQSLKRTHRGGQTKRCFFYYLIGNETVEVSIHRDLQNGVDAFSRIMDDEQARDYFNGK